MPAERLSGRLGAGLLIGLVHLAIIALLWHHHGRSPEQAGSEEYMVYLPILQPPPAQPEARPPPAPAPAPRERRAAAPRQAPAAITIVTTPAPPEAQVESAPPAPAAAPPEAKLDMAALRADARRISASHVPEPFEQVREDERRLEADKRDLGKAIARAKRPPCTKAYSGGTAANIFLLIPLAIDTITDKGCKW